MYRNRGFTLIELLVALAIFAIMSGFAYRSLTAMLDARAALAKESRKWRDTALFVGRVERDLAAVLPRGANTASTPLAPLSSAIDANPGAPGLALSRSGNMLAGNASAAPQRVAYPCARDASSASRGSASTRRRATSRSPRRCSPTRPPSPSAISIRSRSNGAPTGAFPATPR